MKTFLRRPLKGLGYVLAVLIVIRIGLAFVWPTINDVSTGTTPEYPELQQQSFQQPAEKVYEAALATARATGWDIGANDAAAGHIEAVATTQLWKFKDDVAITVSSVGGNTLVNVRSHSRIGKGDLGANARRIHQFQADLAARLAAAH